MRLRMRSGPVRLLPGSSLSRVSALPRDRSDMGSLTSQAKSPLRFLITWKYGEKLRGGGVLSAGSE